MINNVIEAPGTKHFT